MKSRKPKLAENSMSNYVYSSGRNVKGSKFYFLNIHRDRGKWAKLPPSKKKVVISNTFSNK